MMLEARSASSVHLLTHRVQQRLLVFSQSPLRHPAKHNRKP